MTGNHLTKIGRVFDSILFCLLLLGSFCDAQPQRTRRDQCLPGYFGPYCLSCECSNVTRECEPTKLEYESISTLDSTWRLANFDGTVTYVENEPLLYEEVLDFASMLGSTDYINAAYWLAPSKYSGNRLSSYGANLTYTIDRRLYRGDVAIWPIYAPNVVLISTHGLRIAYCAAMMTAIMEQKETIPLSESGWHHIRKGANDIFQDSSAYIGRRVTRSEMLEVLANLKHLMIRSTYAKAQMSCTLIKVSFPIGKSSTTGVESLVEQCHCPEGYSGLSCESCASGYKKIVNDPLNNIPHQCDRHDFI